MGPNSGEFADDRDNHSNQNDNNKTNVWRVDDDNIEEKDLERSFLFSGDGARTLDKPVREGEGTGGDKFGQNNLTPAGDDKNNPSQNAGYSNAYFARTEPSEEHPEDSNFEAKEQGGQPDYEKAQLHSSGDAESPKPQVPERANGENEGPQPEQPYVEGTADGKENNIPGPNELPDQQKVGEKANDHDHEGEHIET